MRIVVSLFFAACVAAEPKPEPLVLGPLGGDTTVVDVSQNAFGQVIANMDDVRSRPFFTGNALFKQSWVTAPASAEATDGLGPVFNATSCSACHLFDGRGRPPIDGEIRFESMLVRLSASDGSPHPVYGNQLQHRAIRTVPGEGNVRVSYEEVPGTYGDGEPYTLLRPTYEFYDMNFGPLGDVLFSPRVGNQLIGLGLLESVPEGAIVALADPDDHDGDGVSGRPNRIGERIGRFGWKANVESIPAQVAGAFLGDIGLTTSTHPAQNCTLAQTECLAAITGGDPEVSDNALELVVFYSRLLAVPAQRTPDAVEPGKALFVSSGCTSCHTPTLHTASMAAEPELAGQTIHPFTDLLLHDMGEGLADGRPDVLADGNEWRTPPLWGLGLVKTVNNHNRLLHDGRARGFAEAILWHGGEGERAKEKFRTMSKTDRDALVAFLESL